MLPYSLDLRERVVAAYEQSGSATIQEVATGFQVGETFVKKMLRQKRETGSLKIKERRHGPAKLLSEKDFKWLRRQIEKEPDATIDRLHERFNNERKLPVSRATIGRAVQSLNLPLKKRVNRQRKETITNEPGTGDGSGS